MRYIHQIFNPEVGARWDNEALLGEFLPLIERLSMPEEEKGRLRDFVRFQLVGERARRTMLPDWTAMTDFTSRADAFEAGAEEAISQLASQIAPVAHAAGVQFDAIIATTATGNLMPGISYRMSYRLGELVRPDSMLVDLGNVGCTGSSKALNLVNALDAGFKNVLVVAVEVPSTLVDARGTTFDLWQGNCTFGDGCAALWVSNDPEQGEQALAIEDLRYRQWAGSGLDLIRWQYRSYYSFALRNEKTFDQDVRQYVVDTLGEAAEGWKEEPRWAIHPAGITLLVRISRKLGIPSEALQPSVRHYREFSNMSSAGVMHILKDVSDETPVGGAVNLLTMGAGFNVIYGRVRRVR